MSDGGPPSPRRRAALATLGAGATALTGGCLGRVRNLVGWQPPRQVQLRIKTLPADADPYALRLAQTVADWFRAAGLETSVVPMAEQELLRQTLLRDEFDVFLMELPARFRDPDGLYTLLHSRFASDPGWQNPFGYADLEVDELLSRQRELRGDRRRDALARIQTTIARAQPFTLLTVPDDIRAARSSAYTNWRSAELGSPLGYLGLERVPGGGETLRVTVTDSRPTTNLNPLSVEFRRTGLFTGLLYDPLGRVADGEVRPWLASSWGFTDGENPSARVALREGATWHDGRPVTASDIAFTYALLADTTLGTGDEAAIPSPRYGSRGSLVEGVRVIDESTAEVRFGEVDPAVAARAFTVPLLPEHVWADRTDAAALGGIDVGTIPEALVTNNVPPVGSGPLRFVRNAPREELVLERFDDHFLHDGDGPEGGLAATVGGAPFDRLRVRAVSSDVGGIEIVADDDADVTATSAGASAVPRIGRRDELELLVGQSSRPYVLGYNTRRPHLNNPQFRSRLAGLVDADHLAETVLGGYGTPAVGPLWGTDWYPESLEWAEGNPVTPFLGDDGTVDPEAARAAFRDAGYRYDDGRLVGN